jgi:hypothetical protein
VAGFDPRHKVISFQRLRSGAFEFESKTRSEGTLVTAEDDAKQSTIEENHHDERDDS